MYLVYSIRSGGWFGKAGSFTSDWQQAKHFSREDALTYVTLHQQADALGSIPVPLADIEEALA